MRFGCFLTDGLWPSPWRPDGESAAPSFPSSLLECPPLSEDRRRLEGPLEKEKSSLCHTGCYTNITGT